MNLLKAKIFLFGFVPFLVLSLKAGNSSAASAIKCHCFTERSYNAADRFAADDYILATSFNSLLSKSYNLPKRQIIMIKMNEGVAQDDLLIGLEVAKITGIDLRKFLRMRKEGKSWANIVAGLNHQEAYREDKVLEAVRAGMDVEQASAMVADVMIAEFFMVEPATIKTFRVEGLTEKEMTLVLILSHVSEIPPEALVMQYIKRGRSWSEIAKNLGLEPVEAGKLILAYPDKKITTEKD